MSVFVQDYLVPTLVMALESLLLLVTVLLSVAYAIYVDERDMVWLTDTGADTVVRFDPNTETFTTVAISRPSNVAQLGGNPGEVWGAQRARDHVFVVRYE